MRWRVLRNARNNLQLVTAGLLAGGVYQDKSMALADADGMKVYRREEIAKHTTDEKGVWVTYNGEVYDITKFIQNHPGGRDKISLAAGKDIGPYWKMYPQHFNSEAPYDMLSKMKIGVLHDEDVKKEEEAQAEVEEEEDDLFGREPDLSPVLNYHMKKPFNAESPSPLLTDNWITPKDLWFVRNHHPTPMIDDTDYLLTISGRGLPHGHVDRAVTFTLADLQTKFNKTTVVSSIQCGGNRRGQMNKVRKTYGSPWNVSAMSNAKWGGVLLSDLLRSVGVEAKSAEASGIQHIQFVGAEGMEASIPVHKGLNPWGDVLIAYEMNDEPIPLQHGKPVRVIVPGHVGVRNVKWLSKIMLSDEESHGPWQRGMSYKGFSPSTRSLEGIDVEAIPSLQEQPVQSAILAPTNDNNTVNSVKPGTTIPVKGYAYSGGGRGIVRVDVSIDDGKNWVTATLKEGSEQPLNKAWAWTFWEAHVSVPSEKAGKKMEIISKATDASYNVQPDTVAGIWNLRGINCNAWHRVEVEVDPDK
jgi:sulfite oxidase